VRAGPGQVHLLVVGTRGDLIHAHAGLGRVVATPPPCPWPIERHWRLDWLHCGSELRPRH
jgi:hypothetical protein